MCDKEVVANDVVDPTDVPVVPPVVPVPNTGHGTPPQV